MGRADNGDSQLIVLDVVDHSKGTDSHPPSELLAQFLRTGRAWIFFQEADRRYYPTPNCRIKLADLLGRGGRELHAVCGHAPSSSRRSDNEIRSPLSSAFAARYAATSRASSSCSSSSRSSTPMTTAVSLPLRVNPIRSCPNATRCDATSGDHFFSWGCRPDHIFTAERTFDGRGPSIWHMKVGMVKRRSGRKLP